MSGSSNQNVNSVVAELLEYEREFFVGLRDEILPPMDPPVIHISDDADTSCEVADVGESDDKPAIVPIIDLSSSSGTSFEAIDAKELLDVPPKRTSTDLSSSPGTSFEIIDTIELSDLSPTIANTAPSSSLADEDKNVPEKVREWQVEHAEMLQKKAPSSSPIDEEENVPEKVRKWQVEYEEMLQKKDAEEEIKKQELHEIAKRELEEFYRSRSEAIAKTKAQNRKTEETRTEEGQDVVDWNIVATLCEFNSKMKPSRKDVSRMREVILRVASQKAGN